MVRCAECGKDEYMPYKCKFCGMPFCSEHRLPEKHSCQGLEEYKKRMREEGTVKYRPEPPREVKRPVRGLLKRLSRGRIFKGSYSLLIIAVIVISFVLQAIIPGYTQLLALSADNVVSHPWALVTYMFVHGGFTHLLFNMIFMAFFAPTLENMIGSRRFLEIFFLAGILAGAVQVLVFGGAVVGASGGLYGVFAALALLAPQIRVFVFFIPIRITHALLLFAAMDIFGMMGGGGGIAHLAHLTGAVVGLYYGYTLKGGKAKGAYS